MVLIYHLILEHILYRSTVPSMRTRHLLTPAQRCHLFSRTLSPLATGLTADGRLAVMMLVPLVLDAAKCFPPGSPNCGGSANSGKRSYRYKKTHVVMSLEVGCIKTELVDI